MVVRLVAALYVVSETALRSLLWYQLCMVVMLQLGAGAYDLAAPRHIVMLETSLDAGQSAATVRS